MGTQDEKREKDNFIMLPTMDFCFKELMQNPKVRKGFIAAILGKAPKEVRRTTLVPTALRKESEDDKLGILDVLIELERQLENGKTEKETAALLGMDIQEVRELAGK